MEGDGSVHKVTRNKGVRKAKRNAQRKKASLVVQHVAGAGSQHMPVQCCCRGIKCLNGGKLRHPRAVCRSKPRKATSGMSKSNPVVSLVQKGQDYLLFIMEEDKETLKPLEVTVLVDGGHCVGGWRSLCWWMEVTVLVDKGHCVGGWRSQC